MELSGEKPTGATTVHRRQWLLPQFSRPSAASPPGSYRHGRRRRHWRRGHRAPRVPRSPRRGRLRRRPSPAEQLVASLNDSATALRAVAVAADVSDHAQVSRLFDAARRRSARTCTSWGRRRRAGRRVPAHRGHVAGAVGPRVRRERARHVPCCREAARRLARRRRARRHFRRPTWGPSGPGTARTWRRRRRWRR